jgi:hypothetical protein
MPRAGASSPKLQTSRPYRAKVQQETQKAETGAWLGIGSAWAEPWVRVFNLNMELRGYFWVPRNLQDLGLH